MNRWSRKQLPGSGRAFPSRGGSAARRALIGLLAASLVGALAGCAKKNRILAPIGTDFAAVFASGGEFADVQNSEEVVSTSTTEENLNGEVYYCTRTTYDITRGFETFPQFDPNAEVVFLRPRPDRPGPVRGDANHGARPGRVRVPVLYGGGCSKERAGKAREFSTTAAHKIPATRIASHR